MKKLSYLLLLALPLVGLSCNKDNKENEPAEEEAFTMTVTLPEDTAESDAVYIVGAFNGGEEFALGNPKWELKGSATQRSIEIIPGNFIGGKTLADGYQFQSPTRGVEVTSDGTVVVRNKKETTITIEAWEKEAGPKFDPSGTWRLVGTINDWDEKVGIDMTREGTTWVAKGVHLQASDEFKFVMDHSWDTNFGAGEPNTKFVAELDEEFDLQPDGGNIKAAAGYYDIYLYPFLAKAKLVDGGPEYPPQGNPVSAISLAPNYLELMEGSSESLTLTIEPADAEVKSIVWESSDPAVASVSQEGLVTGVAEGTATVTVTVDGFSASCEVTVNRESPPLPEEGPTVYVFNATGWIYVYLYAWADGIGDVAASWPGHMPDDVAQVGEYSYYKYNLSSDYSAGLVNLIFNGGENAGQTEDYPITMEGGESYFFYVDSDKAALIPDPMDFDPNDYVTPGPQPSNDPAILYVYNGNGWDWMYLYTWNINGSPEPWPGVPAEATVEVSGHTFLRFRLAAEWCSETEDIYLIFDDNKGNQTMNLTFPIRAGQSYYIYQHGDTAEMIDPENFTPADPPAQDGSWGIAGTMNGWSAASPIEMAVEGAYYVAKGVTLTADTEFKFVQNKSWTVNRGGTFVSLGEEFSLYQDGANIKPGLSGTYDIYIKSDGSSAYIPAP